MGILIDSSVLLGWERGKWRPGRMLEGSEEPFFLSVVVASELLHGAHRAGEPGVRARRSAFAEAILERFPILEIDLATARSHARLWAALAAAGTPVGAHDLWLAATCVAHGLRMATLNVREFRRVPGLVVEDWSRDEMPQD